MLPVVKANISEREGLSVKLDLKPSSQITGKMAPVSMDHVLIKRAKEGDKEAFQNIVSQHLPNILNLATRMLGNRAEAEDLAQEVMVKLWKNLERYDPSKAKLSSWLYRITSNQCLDQLRRKTPEQLDENYDEALSAKQDKELYEKQISKRIGQQLAALPDRQRLALILFHYQGATLKETAEAMQCSVEAVESLLARARRSLKTRLEPLWQEHQEK